MIAQQQLRFRSSRLETADHPTASFWRFEWMWAENAEGVGVARREQGSQARAQLLKRRRLVGRRSRVWHGSILSEQAGCTNGGGVGCCESGITIPPHAPYLGRFNGGHGPPPGFLLRRLSPRGRTPSPFPRVPSPRRPADGRARETNLPRKPGVPPQGDEPAEEPRQAIHPSAFGFPEVRTRGEAGAHG